MLSRKTWLSVLAAATTVFSSISADYWNSGVQNRGTSCCNPCESGTFGVRADFLYWQVREEGLNLFNYAPQVSNVIIPIGTPTVPFNATNRVGSSKSKWEPGFRVGLDYAAPCNGWEVDLLWTHFNQHSKRNALLDLTSESPLSVVSVPVFYPTLFFDFPTNGSPSPATVIAEALAVSASWKFNYNVVDFTFGKDYSCNSCTHLKPYFGARGAWINQKFRSDLVTSLLTAVPPLSDTFSTFGDSKYSAAGVVVGTDASINIGGGFGLYGNFLGSLLYGKYRVKEVLIRKLFPADTANPFDPVTTNLNRDYFKVRANLEGSAGIQYLYNFDCSSQSILVRVGYEAVYWFGQNQFRARVPVNGSQNSDLWFQGLTVTAKYNF